jgi:hypothetical protein
MSSDPKNRSSAPPSSGAPPEPLALAPFHRSSGPTCGSLKRNGEPCQAGATASSGYQFCPWHDPETQEDQKIAWATRGGYAATRGTVVPDAPDPELQEPEQIMAFVQQTAGRVLRGEIAPAVGVALTGLARAALGAFEMNLARRLAQLEEVAAGRAKPIGAKVVIRNQSEGGS